MLSDVLSAYVMIVRTDDIDERNASDRYVREARRAALGRKFVIHKLCISTVLGAQEHRGSTQIFEVRTAAGAAIGRAKSGYRNAAANSAIQHAFAAPGANHIDDANTGCREQVVDVPTQRLLLAEMVGDAGVDMVFRRTGVEVSARRKFKFAQAADNAPQRLRHFDQQLVANFPRHRDSVQRGMSP